MPGAAASAWRLVVDTQRGMRGAAGERGPAGRGIASVHAADGAVVLVMDDGQEHLVEIATAPAAPDDDGDGLPIRRFRGRYSSGKHYLRGDVVNFGGVMMLAAEDTNRSPGEASDDWVNMAAFALSL